MKLFPQIIDGCDGPFVVCKGEVAFRGYSKACRVFVDAYDSFFEGVAVCHAPGPLADAAEAGMELAIKHGTHAHKEFAA